jgi:hypothetical protein
MLKRLVVLFMVALTFINIRTAAAFETPPLITKSKYFSILGPADFDIINALNKLDYDYFLQTESLLEKQSSDPKDILARTIDAIFLHSSKVLGITAYDFQATLEFLPDQNTVKIVVQQLTGTDINERAFYLHEVKTIYISMADLTVGMLGHEMAHAIISYYFGAPPSSNIQEILAGYVDYSLQKTTGTLIQK